MSGAKIIHDWSDGAGKYRIVQAGPDLVFESTAPMVHAQGGKDALGEPRWHEAYRTPVEIGKRQANPFDALMREMTRLLDESTVQ